MSYKETYDKWCTDLYFDEVTRAELKALEGSASEDRFYRRLEFGTGGLGGVIGAGTNRMNILYGTSGYIGPGKLYYFTTQNEERNCNCI